MLSSSLQAHNYSDSNAQKNNHYGCNNNPSCSSNVSLRWLWRIGKIIFREELASTNFRFEVIATIMCNPGLVHKSDVVVWFQILFGWFFQTFVALPHESATSPPQRGHALLLIQVASIKKASKSLQHFMVNAALSNVHELELFWYAI